MNTNTEAMMSALEQMKDTVATWTGIKQQLIDSGWSEPAAEAIVIEIIRKG